MEQEWPAIRRLFRQSLQSSFHYAIASVDEEGKPHVTPIGSLILGQPGQGYFFEAFTKGLPGNVRANPQVCVLAVNSNKLFWLKSLVAGKFSAAPAVRLHGTIGDRRQATDQEYEAWQRRVRPFRFTRGHKMLWANMRVVRDIRFSTVDPVNIGPMTHGLQDDRSR